jgi:hypothetical protein
MGARASASPRIDRPRRSGVELPLRLSMLARIDECIQAVVVHGKRCFKMWRSSAL